MSIDSLKKQASRLAAYLGAKHRVNLKHASALEAIAAVHGARNWQTLSASPQDDDVVVPEAATSFGARGTLALTWDKKGQPHLQMSRHGWLRHAIAFGDTAYAWVQDNAVEAAQGGIATLVLGLSHTFVGLNTGGDDEHEVRQVRARELVNLIVPASHLVVVTTDDAPQWVARLTDLLKAKVNRDDRTPLVVGLPALESMTNEELQSLGPIVKQGRAYGITLRCFVEDKEAFLRIEQSSTILANMSHQLYMGNAREAIHQEVLERLEQAPVVYMSNGITQF